MFSFHSVNAGCFGTVAGSHRSSSKAIVVDVIVVKMHNDHGEPQPSRRCCRNCTTYSGHPNSEPNVYEGCLAVGLLLYIIQSVEF